MGNVHIHKYNDEFIELEERRSITNKQRMINYLQIYEVHDIIVIGYEGDDNIHFYAYEKGKILGSLNDGKREVVKTSNPYAPDKFRKRIVAVNFFERQHCRHSSFR